MTRHRPLAYRHAVEDFIQHPAGAGQASRGVRADTRFIFAGVGFFQQQDRDQRCQVRIAAAFAQSVQRTLDLARARIDGGQRTGNRVFGVVVGVDAKVRAGDACCDNFRCDPANFGR